MKEVIKELQQICNKYKIDIIGSDFIYRDGKVIEEDIIILSEEES